MKPMVWLAWLLLDWPVTLTVGLLLIALGLVGIPLWAWWRHHRPGRARAGRVMPAVCCHARPIRSTTTYQAPLTPRRRSTSR